MLLERLEDCHEVSFYLLRRHRRDHTSLCCRWPAATFVDGSFGIEPNSIGMKVFGALAGRRLMRTWLSSLENLKETAERAARQPA